MGDEIDGNTILAEALKEQVRTSCDVGKAEKFVNSYQIFTSIKVQ